MDILFSEGSSTSARQSLSALGPLGHAIDLCDPQALCLGRFSRYTRSWYRCPAFNRQPAEYLAFLVDRLQHGRYEVLLATHDQVFLLSRYREDLGRLVNLAVPPFEAVRALQSKVQLAQLYHELNLPQPDYRIAEAASELMQVQVYPCYVKQEFGTAGRGVWRIESPAAMAELVERLTPQARYIVQQPAVGDYFVAQAVFQEGRLVAAHNYTMRAQGVGGSAHARVSVRHPQIEHDLQRLGAALDWHGALHLEYFVDRVGQRQHLEANPRIGETMNATQAGVNLCDVLVRVSCGEQVAPLPPSRADVRTHSVMTSLLGVAQRGGSRRELLAEMAAAWQQRGVYDRSVDELTRLDEDPRSLIPLVAVAARLLLRPSQGEQIIRTAVENYSLNEEAIRRALALPDALLASPLRAILDSQGAPF